MGSGPAELPDALHPLERGRALVRQLPVWMLAGLVIIALNVFITKDFEEHSND